MKTASLVFGAGEIGTPLAVDRLYATTAGTSSRSRAGNAGSAPTLAWKRGDFADMPPLPQRVDALFCCGPLDLFSRWYAGSGIEAARGSRSAPPSV